MTAVTRLSLGVVTALFLSSIPTRAEEPRFGVQVHGNAPTGTLKDVVGNKLGLGGGVHMTFDLGQGHLLRPRVDFMAFPEASLASGFAETHNKVQDLSAGVDYLYFLDGKPEGLYLTAGLALHRWKVDSSTPGMGWSMSDTSRKAGFAVGLGYNFNASVGGELRFTSSVSPDSNQGNTPFRTGTAIQAGITFRF